jgi:hypothetical protein
VSWQVTTTGDFDRLSMALMLVSTNDAFSGLDAVQLPKWRGETVLVKAYDAGSECRSTSAPRSSNSSSICRSDPPMIGYRSGAKSWGRGG